MPILNKGTEVRVQPTFKTSDCFSARDWSSKIRDILKMSLYGFSYKYDKNWGTKTYYTSN